MYESNCDQFKSISLGEQAHWSAKYAKSGGKRRIKDPTSFSTELHAKGISEVKKYFPHYCFKQETGLMFF